MSNINILIVEDDAFEAQLLTSFLEQFNYNIVAIASTLDEALKHYSTYEIDLVIIDIFLDNEPHGITFAETILKDKEQLKPFMFLTSSTSQNVFKNAKITHPFSYLLKPFNELELQYALELAIEKFAQSPNSFSMHNHPAVMINKAFFIKKNNALVKVLLSDIYCIEVEGRYSNIKTEKDQFIVQLSLKQFLEKIQSPNFIRVHRNYIINTDKIDRVFLSDNLIILQNNINVTLGRLYRSDFIKQYEILT